MFDSILLTETLRERAASNSLSIDLALSFTGGGYFDYIDDPAAGKSSVLEAGGFIANPD
jgi:hypothetical protein